MATKTFRWHSLSTGQVTGRGLSFGAALVAMGFRVLRWIELSRQRRQLASLDHRMLKDIGVSRADADRENASGSLA